MASIITAVRSLVLAGLRSTTAFNVPDPVTKQKPDVQFGWKNDWKAREKVFTSNARFTHAPASMRAVKTFRNEDGGFDLVILIAGIAQDAETVCDRALALGETVEDWCATHANWQGQIPGLNWLQISGEGSLAEAYGDKGVLAELTYPITYQARLT